MTDDDTLRFSFWNERGEYHADWRDAYTTQTTFRLADAACILAGIPPGYNSPQGSDERPSLKAKLWAETLETNIDELVTPMGRNDATPSMHVLSHDKIRAWCTKDGIDWPIPENYVERIKSLEQELEEERSLRLKAQNLADPVMSLFVKEDAPPSSPLRELEALMLSRVESVGLSSVAQAIGGNADELLKSYKQDVKKWAELFDLLRLQVSHEPNGSSPAQPDAPLPTPVVLRTGDPEEVYRHLDYLTEEQALDWMSRISGHHVEWDTLWGMVGFGMCDAFMDCRAVSGLTYAADGEHEHRKVFGLGICQIMNAVKNEGSPLHLLGPAIHVDMYGLQEIVPKRSWWINDLQDYSVLFRPSDIEKMGRIVNDRGGWSSIEPIQTDEQLAEHSGSDLVQRLAKLQISINNFNDRMSYCVRFEDGQLLAELGSNLKPLGLVNAQPGISFSDAEKDYESEIARLNQVVVEQSAQLHAHQEEEGSDSYSAKELVFPYATRELEAMRAVALQYWAPYTPEKRMPTQKEIGLELCTILNLQRQSSGDPARKAIVLATAVRPDTIPDLNG